MKNNTSTQQRAIDTKNKIMNTFFGLLEHKSINEITIQMICVNCGISVGAFYHHYSSKEDILEEKFHHFDEFIDKELTHKQYATSEEAIIDFLFHLIMGAQNHGINVTREVLKYTLTPTSHNYFSVQNRASHNYLLTLLDKAIASGELRRDCNPKELAILLLRHAHGIGYDWVAQNGNYDLSNALHYDLRLILKSFKNDVD